MQQTAYDKALVYFNKARKSNNNYLKFDYFLKDVGAVLYELNRFSLAADFYQIAILLGEANPLQHALYGDALLFKGYYELAAKHYDICLTYERENEYGNDEWQLKYMCAATLVKNGYPLQQKRNTIQALKLCELDANKTDDMVVEQLYKALDFDSLCTLAWYNLGQLYLKRIDHHGAFFPFLISALINKTDVDSWIKATFLSIELFEFNLLLKFIVNTAYFYN